jgi:hypothetical protein
MKINIFKIAANTSLIALLMLSGCSNLTPEQNAFFAGVAGAGAGAGIQALTGNRVNALVPILSGLGAAVVTEIYCRYEADAKQKRIAEERARNYYSQLSPAKKAKTGKYLAVETTSNEPTKGKAVMLYNVDTQKTQNVYYDMKPVSVGSNVKVKSNDATYIGTGT